MPKSIRASAQSQFQSVRTIFGNPPEDVITPIGTGSDTLWQMESIFFAIEVLREKGGCETHIKQLLRLGKYVSCDMANCLNLEYETMRDSLKAFEAGEGDKPSSSDTESAATKEMADARKERSESDNAAIAAHDNARRTDPNEVCRTVELFFGRPLEHIVRPLRHAVEGFGYLCVLFQAIEEWNASNDINSVYRIRNIARLGAKVAGEYEVVTIGEPADGMQACINAAREDQV